METIEVNTLTKLTFGDETLPIHFPGQTRADVPEAVNGDREARRKWTDMWQTNWVTISPAASGYTKLRVGARSEPMHSGFAVFGEIQDGSGQVVQVFYDPSEHPVPFFRAHIFHVHGDRDNRGIGSIVFQNEHSTDARRVRVNFLSRRP
jgi:hypothetical protein